MGNGNRATGLNLLFKQRNHTAVTAQNIAETHCHELCSTSAAHHLYHHLTQALGSTHNVGGVHCLIGGNQHKLADTVLCCSLCHFESTHYIVLNGFVGAVFHQRHMLVGSCVENNMGTIGIHHRIHTGSIAYGTDQNRQIQIRILPLQFQLNIVGIVFIDVKNHQFFRIIFGDLTAKLGANRAATAGNHDTLTGDVLSNLFPVNLDRITAQQVLHFHIAQTADLHFPVDQLIDAGNHLDLTAGCTADIQNLLFRLSVAGRDRIDDLLNIILLDCRGNILSAADNGNTLQNAVLLRHIIVDQADNFVVHQTTVANLTDQRTAGFTGTDDHHILSAPGTAAVGNLDLQLPQEAVRKAQTNRTNKAEQHAQKIKGQGHLHRQQCRHQQAGNSQENICQNDAEHFIDTDKTPNTLIQTKYCKAHQRQRDPRADHGAEKCHILRGDCTEGKLITYQQSRKKRHGNAKNIHEHNN